VLLDVWGPGCAAVQAVEPIVIRLATKYQGRVKVAEINAADNPRTMRKLGVMGTPTVLYFKEVTSWSGWWASAASSTHSELIEEELLDPPAASAEPRPRPAAGSSRRAGGHRPRPPRPHRAHLRARAHPERVGARVRRGYHPPMSAPGSPLLEKIRAGVIGDDQVMQGPYARGG
jgi:hypothetical protein